MSQAEHLPDFLYAINRKKEGGKNAVTAVYPAELDRMAFCGSHVYPGMPVP